MDTNVDAKDIFGWLISLLSILGGTFIIAFSLQVLLGPYTIAGGGVTGLAIILNKVTAIPKYIIIFVVSFLLFIFGAKILGIKSAILTLLTTISLTLMLKFLPFSQPLTDNLMLSAIFGGVTLGVGMGIIFRTGATLGSSDLAGVILSNYFPTFRMATGMGFLDLLIVIFAGVIDKNVNTSLYSLITIFFCTMIADMILTGSTVFKAFYIISSKPEEVGSELMNKLGRAVTVLDAEGMYSRNKKRMLLCVVNKAQFIRCKDIIADIDSDAFVMICDASEVFGVSFKKPKVRKKKTLRKV
ncbi:MAG: hypothetical protein CR988_05305 [Treponema sp.]|nr:MAG: hypothetical protein CR988_05305 [Treponema sp.]